MNTADASAHREAFSSSTLKADHDEEMHILEEHINPSKTHYLPSHTRRRVEYALRTAWTTTICLVLLQFFQWTPVASELSPVISIISATLFFGAWQQAAFKVLYATIIGASLGSFCVGPLYKLPSLQLIALFITASSLNGVKKWDRVTKVMSSLSLVLGSLIPNLTAGKITLVMSLYSVLALVNVPYLLTGLSLLFPWPAFSLFNAKDKALIVCRKLSLMTRALIRAFPSGAYLDLYIAEYDELHQELISDLADLQQVAALLPTERSVLWSAKDMVPAVEQFLKVVNALVRELNGIRDCVSVLVQSQMQNQFNELLIDTLVEIDEEVEITLCVVGEFFDTFQPFFIDNCICRSCLRIYRTTAAGLRFIFDATAATAFSCWSRITYQCCSSNIGSGGSSSEGNNKRGDEMQYRSACDVCDSHVANARLSAADDLRSPSHPLNTPFKRPESFHLRRQHDNSTASAATPTAAAAAAVTTAAIHGRDSLHVLRHRSRVRKIYNIPFSCDLIDEHESRSYGRARHFDDFEMFSESLLLRRSSFHHYSLSLGNLNCKVPDVAAAGDNSIHSSNSINSGGCGTCSVPAAATAQAREPFSSARKSVRDEDCTGNEARNILHHRFLRAMKNLQAAQSELLLKYQEGREHIIILPFAASLNASQPTNNSSTSAAPPLPPPSSSAVNAAVSVVDRAVLDTTGTVFEELKSSDYVLSMAPPRQERANSNIEPDTPNSRAYSVSGSESASTAVSGKLDKQQWSQKQTRRRGFTVDSIDPTGPPLCGNFQPTRRHADRLQQQHQQSVDEADESGLDSIASNNANAYASGLGVNRSSRASSASKREQQSGSTTPPVEHIRLNLRNLGRRASYVHRLSVLVETLDAFKSVFEAQGKPWSLWNDVIVNNSQALYIFGWETLQLWFENCKPFGALLWRLLQQPARCSSWFQFCSDCWNTMLKPFLLENMQALKIAAATCIAASLLIFKLAPSLYKEGLWTTAVIPLIRQDETSASFLTSYQRLEGTVIGSIFAFMIFQTIGCGTLEKQCSPSLLLPIVIAWVALCALFREGPRHGYAATVAGFTPLILLLGLQTDLQGAWGRIEETFVGISIYLLIDNLVMPRRTYTMLKKSVLQCVDETRLAFSESIHAAQVLLSLQEESSAGAGIDPAGADTGVVTAAATKSPANADGGSHIQADGSISTSAAAASPSLDGQAQQSIDACGDTTAAAGFSSIVVADPPPGDLISMDHQQHWQHHHHHHQPHEHHHQQHHHPHHPHHPHQQQYHNQGQHHYIKLPLKFNPHSFTISARNAQIFTECLTSLDHAEAHLSILDGALSKQQQWLRMVVHEPDLWYRTVPTAAYERLTLSFHRVLRAGQVVTAGYRAFSSLLIQMLGRREPLTQQLQHYNFFIQHSFAISSEAEKALCLAHDAFKRLYELGQFHADLSHIVILRRSADNLLKLSHEHFLTGYMRRPAHELIAINPYLNVAWQNLFEGVFTLAEEVSALGMTLHSIRNIEALVSV